MHVPDVATSRTDAAAPTSRSGERVAAWRPDVPGVAEVLHARFVDHVYPSHTHATWTLLIVDDGAIRFDLDRREHGAVQPRVTLLPPHVAHTGRAGTASGFHKRVLYLDQTVLGEELIGAAVDGPSLVDPVLRWRVRQLHDALNAQEDTLEAESRLALIGSRLHEHLQRRRPSRQRPALRAGVAEELRALLDSRVATGLTLQEASGLLHAHPDSLVRGFTAAFGLPPHRYLIGRRVDLARRLLLDGNPVADVATRTGFHDQAHLTRHFGRQLGVTPARFARGSPPARPR